MARETISPHFGVGLSVLEVAQQATIQISRRLRTESCGKAHLVLQVHDEFVVDADRDVEAVASTKRLIEEDRPIGASRPERLCHVGVKGLRVAL